MGASEGECKRDTTQAEGDVHVLFFFRSLQTYGGEGMVTFYEERTTSLFLYLVYLKGTCFVYW